MIALLALDTPLKWSGLDRNFSFTVLERTIRSRNESKRLGTVRVEIRSGARGWTDVEATTTWSDPAKNKENVWLKQNDSTGAIYCYWVKGTERAHVFTPPIQVWAGEGSTTIRMTPTFRPFGHHVLSGGKSQGYDAPVMNVEVDGSGITFGGEATWKGGDALTPIDYRLTGEFRANWISSKEPGFDGRRVHRLRRVVSGKEVLSQKTGPNEKQISETTWNSDDDYGW